MLFISLGFLNGMETYVKCPTFPFSDLCEIIFPMCIVRLAKHICAPPLVWKWWVSGLDLVHWLSNSVSREREREWCYLLIPNSFSLRPPPTLYLLTFLPSFLGTDVCKNVAAVTTNNQHAISVFRIFIKWLECQYSNYQHSTTSIFWDVSPLFSLFSEHGQSHYEVTNLFQVSKRIAMRTVWVWVFVNYL